MSQQRSESPGAVEVTRLALRATAGGGCRVAGGGGVFRAVLQRVTRGSARVALVPDRALLLAGDNVALEVDVDPGLHLTLVETAGTVAYDMRGGRASWSTVFRIGAGATVVHETLPWVSAAGSDVTRSLEIELARDARALLRETLVLGRHDEEAGRLRTRSHVRREGADVFVEETDSVDFAPHRVLDQVAAFGEFHPASVSPAVPPYVRADAIATHLPPAAPGVTCLELASGDTIWRRLDAQAHVAALGWTGSSATCATEHTAHRRAGWDRLRNWSESGRAVATASEPLTVRAAPHEDATLGRGDLPTAGTTWSLSQRWEAVLHQGKAQVGSRNPLDLGHLRGTTGPASARARAVCGGSVPPGDTDPPHKRSARTSLRSLQLVPRCAHSNSRRWSWS